MTRLINLFSLLFLFGIAEAFANQLAIVTKDQTMLYSDPELKTPAIEVLKGRIFEVSNELNTKGEGYTVTMVKRTLYVNPNDVYLYDEISRMEQKNAGFQKQLEKHLRDEKYSNYEAYSFQLGQFRAGDHWNTLSKQKNSSSAVNDIGINFSIKYESTLIPEALSYRLGLEYLEVSDRALKFYAPSIVGELSILAFRVSNFLAEVYGGILFSYSPSDPIGYQMTMMYGGRSGINLSYYITDSIGVRFNGSYYYSFLKNGLGNYLDHLSGEEISLGLLYKL